MIKADMIKKTSAVVVLSTLVTLLSTTSAFAQEGGVVNSPIAPIGAGLAIGLAVIGGATAQGKAVSAMLEAFGRNPSVGGKLLAPMLIGMALIESLVILAFVVALRTL